MSKIWKTTRVIRHATQRDVTSIHELAESLRLREKGDEQQGGFLVDVPEKEVYAGRIVSPYSYVAEQDGKFAGFLIGFDRETLTRIVNSELGGDTVYRNQLAGFMLKHRKPFVWGHQIGVKPELARHQIGTTLLGCLFEDMKADKISICYVNVLRNPVVNQASVDFCKKQGFRRVDYFTEHNAPHIWDWDIYRRDIKW